MSTVRVLIRPLGHLAFVAAVALLSGAARLLGEHQELGYFSGRLAESIRRYPEVTRRGVQVAWTVWAGLLIFAASPLDPAATRWDEVALVVIAVLALWRRSPDRGAR
jgi:hypothetical protein